MVQVGTVKRTIEYILKLYLVQLDKDDLIWYNCYLHHQHYTFAKNRNMILLLNQFGFH